MPELPEVETVVRSITPYLVGKKILSAAFHSDRVTRGNHRETASQLADSTILDISRRGKQIWVRLDRGFLYIHLGMTGKLLWNASPGKYTRASIQITDGCLLFDDIRTFGRIEFFAQVPPGLERIGPDALSVSFDEFYLRLRQRRGKIKAVLLNQTFLAGVGNIYADEALFSAGIHPRASVQKLSKSRAMRLHRELLQTLNTAILHRGSSISDYVDGRGERGQFQQFHRVYGRAAEPCRACGKVIRRIVLAQRGTHYCPCCQRV